MCGAALIPLSQSILFSINSKKDYPKAVALWGVGVTMGPILGPLLGGWLTESYNWRWVFYINVPIGIIAFIGLYFYLPETELKKQRFDFFGFITLSIFVGMLQIFLDRGELLDWFGSIEIITEALICGVSLYLFIVHILSCPDEKSFLNCQLFSDRNFTIAAILIFVVGMVFYSTLPLLPPMLQNQLNYPVTLVGIVTAPRGIGSILGMIIVGQVAHRLDPRLILFSAMVIVAVSLWQMTQFSLYVTTKVIILTGILQGLGVGLLLISVSTAYTPGKKLPHVPGQHFLPNEPVSATWWTTFKSPELNQVIEQGIENSNTLITMQEKLGQAQEMVNAATGQLYPQIAMQGSVGRQKFGAAVFGGSGFTVAPFTYYNIGPGVSLNPDIFGGTRRTIEQQQAIADYQNEELKAAYLALTGNITTTAITIANLNAQIANTHCINN